MRILGTSIPLLLTYYQNLNWQPANKYEFQAFNAYCHEGAEQRSTSSTISEMKECMKIINKKENIENLLKFCLENDIPSQQNNSDNMDVDVDDLKIQHGEVDLFE